MSEAWDRQPGEPARWFQRFETYRLAGVGRGIETTWRAEQAEKAQKGRERPRKAASDDQNHRPARLPGSWRRAAEGWQWRARAEAWDRHLVQQAEAEVEAKWRAKVMAPVEALGRMSEMGRGNALDFITLDKDGRGFRLNNELPKDEWYRVKKVSSSKGKTDSISIELYDAQSAIQTMGKQHRLFTGQEQPGGESKAGSFVFPADVVAPSFLEAYRDIRDQKHSEYVFYGGRGSTKSSFVSLAFVWLLVNHPEIHGLAARQVANTLRDSVYSQLVWAIDELGLGEDFKCTTSPLEIEYRPSGQKIYFRGADDPGKIKSIKPAHGYIGLLWFEELDQFHGEEAVRKIEQSVIRGGDLAFTFKSFNPPRTKNNWANKYTQIPKEAQYQHRSTYLDVPQEWLGKPFLNDAEHLKAVNPPAYEHEYLGIANSAGGLVFENVQIRQITDEEIAQFDRVLHGLDWGFYPDPAHYVRCHYDAARLTLYIYGEHRAFKAGNRVLYDGLVEKGLSSDDLIIADSAEPKSVADFREYATLPIQKLDKAGQPVLERGKPVVVYGPNCRGAEKGPESVKYSMKWMQSLAAIVIDNRRCPATAEEFLNYEYERDKDGEVISEYPDRDNHAIDAARYATNLIWKRRGK